ncbi:MAG TPA: DNA repair exonuclease [Candidatus Binataceae bacterium]|nr:DNA repair exonuclease [Candidatus Binataceae bacterium]
MADLRAAHAKSQEDALAGRARKPLRFVHTSDVHLETDTFGSGAAGNALRDRVRQSFANVIELANTREADLLLIVGDLFDSSRVTEEGLAFAMGTIARAKMPAILIPGNHDAHDERSIYAGLRSSSLPSNLRLILEPDGTSILFEELQTHVWGRALVEHTPEYRPLGGIPSPHPDFWNIAMAHGFFVENGEVDRSSPIFAKEIQESGYDYIALGHVHVYSDVSQGPTRALYCGTPAPLYSSDNSGWVAVVDCFPGEELLVQRALVKA